VKHAAVVTQALRFRHARRTARGLALLEVLFVLAVTSIAASAAGGALRGLSRTTELETARLRTLTTLLDARRRAYGEEATCEVAAATGASTLTLRASDGSVQNVALPPDTHVTHSVASGRVRFFATGLAENATIVVGTRDDAEQASVIVNQRGLVR
jgi:type II secretory pathway pseudopilin PulG